MYTTTQRGDGSYFQRTFSWRTGRRASGDSPREVTSDPPHRLDGENLGTYIGRRNQYFKTLASNLQSQAAYQGHVLATDGGHSFHTARVDYGLGSYTFKVNGTVNRRGRSAPYLRLLEPDRLFLSQAMTGKPPIGTVTGRPAIAHPDSGNHLGSLDMLVRGAVNSTIPDAAQFGWGETVVELLRGNYPKVLPDFVKRITRGRKLDPKATAKSLGSDYLNARFGIEPIYRDLIGTAAHLMSVHDNMYDSYKRSRHTQRVFSNSTENRALVSFGDGTAEVQNIPGFSTTLASDSRLVCKYAKARPSSRAQGFYDKAVEELNRYGVNQKLTWDLLPYSWLVDWFSDIGRSIETAAALNPANGRFTTTYSYTTRLTTYLSVGTQYYKDYGANTAEFGYAGWTNAVVKERSPISPFGPGFRLPTLSPYQWSILVSLGLAKIK